jgi:hypothetical protein
MFFSISGPIESQRSILLNVRTVVVFCMTYTVVQNVQNSEVVHICYSTVHNAYIYIYIYMYNMRAPMSSVHM